MSLRSLWFRVSRPFTVRVYTFEHTRVRVRSFPPLFTHEWTESLAERIARGGQVSIEAGTHVVYDSLTLEPGQMLAGEGEGSSRSVIEGVIEADS